MQPRGLFLAFKPEFPPFLDMRRNLSKTQDTVLNGIVRHILTAAGGALVARGSLAESELDLAVGAVITLAGIIWSAIAKRKAK